MATDQHKQFIQRLVEASVQSLAGSIGQYWPVVNPERNGLQEANLVTHLAAVGLAKGGYAYPEASNGNTELGHSRIDLLLLWQMEQARLALLVEAKKLFSADKAAELVSDFEKMQRFAFVRDGQLESFQAPQAMYGLLMAVTTSAENSRWWEDPYEWDAGASWDRLKEVLEQAGIRAAIKLEGPRPQYILYALYRLNADFGAP